eukprot:1737943-Prymnesium_polylepis.2
MVHSRQRLPQCRADEPQQRVLIGQCAHPARAGDGLAHEARPLGVTLLKVLEVASEALCARRPERDCRIQRRERS